MEDSRWGIIFCPRGRKHRIHKEWDAMRSYLTEKGVLYDFVQSEGPESVERLASMLASNGYKTIIVVGGDSALNKALNGILSQGEEARKSIALGVIPNGMVNDFAHFWGFEDGHYKQSIDWLVKKRIRKVDVGVCTCEGELRKSRFFFNCVNVGLVANIMSLKRRTKKIFGLSGLSYLTSIFLLLFQRKEHKMRMRVNQEEINRSIMTVCIGSAKGYGQTPSAVPYNGMLDVSIVSHPELTKTFEAIWMLLRGSFLNHKAVKSYRTKSVQIYDKGKAKLSLDSSEWVDAVAPINVSVRQEWVNFIIP